MLDILDDLFKNPSPTASRDLEADEIILIADRSGSMYSIQPDAQGGINTFIAEQKKEGNANLTFIEFDSEIDAVYRQTDIKEATEYELVPRGATALYDAIGATLANAESIKTTGKKIVVIVTDGGENASQEWTQENVFKRIETLKEAGWDFLFLAANQNAMKIGMSLGMSAGETVAYNFSGEGSQAGYAAAVNYTTNLRGGMSKSAVMDALDTEIQTSSLLSKTGNVSSEDKTGDVSSEDSGDVEVFVEK